MDDEDPRLPPAEPFPLAIRNDINPSSDAPAPVSPDQAQPAPAASISTESAVAPQRKTRGPRLAQPDLRTELQNAELGEWSTNYLDNMADLARVKEQRRSIFQAKKNAAFWILGQGIGGVQANFGDDRQPHPLAMFSGQELLDALKGPLVAGVDSPGGSGKRARSSSPQEDGERRVRARTEDAQEEMGRGVGDDGVVLGFDDEGVMVQGDEFQRVSSLLPFPLIDRIIRNMNADSTPGVRNWPPQPHPSPRRRRFYTAMEPLRHQLSLRLRPARRCQL